jgi:STE24 endopeptidase
MLLAATTVFILAPEILRRVLHTQRLPETPLRRRLETMCRRHGLRYRDILLWHTDNNMGNAAVMGVLPRLRYILLSDLLLETMTDEQIEAVFAHEVGHIVHWHMQWYVVFFGILMGFMIGPAQTLANKVQDYVKATVPRTATDKDPRKVRADRYLALTDLAALVVGAGGTLTVFGFLSRRFERQADVFAARTIQLHTRPPAQPPEPPAAPASPDGSYVGPHGATLFASALERVAAINNIPVAARSWCHGSIEKRMRYLHHLSADPTHTTRFDRFMLKLYIVLVVALVIFGAWAAVSGVPAS